MTLRVTFLGTSAAIPTTGRNPSGLMVNREGNLLLFDVGEGTQRQMMRYGTGFGVSDVFISHLHGDHVFGLPGLLQTWDFTDRTDPLTIHVPVGTADRLRTVAFALDGRPSFPVSVTEHEPGSVALAGDGYDVRTIATAHRTRSIGYVLTEDARKGRFDRERAEALGVPVGPKFSQLHEGRSVELEDGTVVDPEQVVGPPRPGRTIAYTGDTRPVEAVIDAATDADLLIHDATFTTDRSDRARDTAHSTAKDAGYIADRANVDHLVLTHISSRYPDASQHAAEASAVFDGTVTVAADGLELDVPYPDD